MLYFSTSDNHVLFTRDFYIYIKHIDCMQLRANRLIFDLCPEPSTAGCTVALQLECTPHYDRRGKRRTAFLDPIHAKR